MLLTTETEYFSLIPDTGSASSVISVTLLILYDVHVVPTEDFPWNTPPLK